MPPLVHSLLFSHQFITMDETRVHHLTPETKEQLKQWTERRESAPKEAKIVSSAGNPARRWVLNGIEMSRSGEIRNREWNY